ncbi:MAG: putative redox protein, partial [Flavobacteriaceae bacterium]
PTLLKMEVEGLRHAGAVPSLFYQIEIVIYLKGNFSADKAKRAAKLSFDKYCSVSKTLEPTAVINHRIVFNGEPL